mmetsp:Transcript_1757/g.3439  ORF Transcript_1757/g.3439 Transcript_1757/m.3439 type:complete len:94 (-) Transcript_1757:857-1138(-)
MANHIAKAKKDVGEHDPIFPHHLQSEIMQSGEWCPCKESVACSTPKFDILESWEAMPLRLPLLYPDARRILAIPHTLCDLQSRDIDLFFQGII